jgi:hypothetical protein
MHLQRLTLDHMFCFAIGFPLFRTTEYPQAPLAPCGLVGIAIPVLLIQQDKLTRAFPISQQAVSYQTRGGTCCPRVSTPTIGL